MAGYLVAFRTARDIELGRSASMSGTQYGAAWPTIEAATRAVPHYAVEWTIVSTEGLKPRRGKSWVVLPEGLVDAEIESLRELRHIA